MKPCCLKDGSAWYIELTWPNGRVEHIDSFQSESEINDWIIPQIRRMAEGQRQMNSLSVNELTLRPRMISVLEEAHG